MTGFPETSMQGNRHCIVSPEALFLTKNGGIGTHASNLAYFLAELGKETTILFTGDAAADVIESATRHYSEHKIKLVCLNQLPSVHIPISGDIHLSRSVRTYLYLRRRDFSYLHFQDYQANGFHTIQAKRTTDWFSSTRIAVTIHSSTEWLIEAFDRWSPDPIGNARLMWMERYCCEFADMVISPSRYMIDWARSRGWRLAEPTTICPYMIRCAPLPEHSQADGVLAFFGRLEYRKGLTLFLRTLERLGRRNIRHVHFIGRNGDVGTHDGIGEITSVMPRIDIPFTIHAQLESHEAQQLLTTTGALAVLPSLVENYPNAAIECIAHSIPIVATSVGGFPELLDPACLCEPTPPALAALIGRALAPDWKQPEPPYRADRAREAWLDALHALEQPSERRPVIASERPLVTVCIPHHNHGHFLHATLQSVLASDYENFEVVVLDDGSTDPESRSKFTELAARYGSDRVRFLSTENGGIGEARNRAAAASRGSFLMFVDADNVVMPSLISALVMAIERSQADAVTCWLKAFAEDDDDPHISGRILFTYLPIGPCNEVGTIDNVYGDANFLVRKAVFDRLGGFTTERGTTWEDWEFLAKLSLAGHALEVLPEFGFWYRVTANGAQRTTSAYKNHLRVLKPFLARFPDLQRSLQYVWLPLARSERTAPSRESRLPAAAPHGGRITFVALPRSGRITFSDPGTSLIEFEYGWSLLESNGIWSEGATSTLLLTQPMATRNWRVTLSIRLLADERHEQSVSFLVGDEEVFKFSSRESKRTDVNLDFQFEAPRKIARIECRYGAALSPHALHGSKDIRQISMFIYGITVHADAQPLPAYRKLINQLLPGSRAGAIPDRMRAPHRSGD